MESTESQAQEQMSSQQQQLQFQMQMQQQQQQQQQQQHQQQQLQNAANYGGLHPMHYPIPFPPHPQAYPSMYPYPTHPFMPPLPYPHNQGYGYPYGYPSQVSTQPIGIPSFPQAQVTNSSNVLRVGNSGASTSSGANIPPATDHADMSDSDLLPPSRPQSTRSTQRGANTTRSGTSTTRSAAFQNHAASSSRAQAFDDQVPPRRARVSFQDPKNKRPKRGRDASSTYASGDDEDDEPPKPKTVKDRVMSGFVAIAGCLLCVPCMSACNNM
eukprot:TRINITY_DN2921_c0_g3_i1.p1 TRINITY_DN2921_c0_g3~~TRINITY_DN2921_c0_g3_i1.p1  ORF type:complete len:270 (-),score=50.11 TRINITY_DN2921_c0_g3_i1:710-1519(-)